MNITRNHKHVHSTLAASSIEQNENTPVAVPGGEGRGANPQDGGANLLFGQTFPENCMKMKEIGPRGRPWRSP